VSGAACARAKGEGGHLSFGICSNVRCIYTYTHTYIRMYTRIYVYIDTHTYIRMYTRIYVFIISIYVYIYEYIYM